MNLLKTTSTKTALLTLLALGGVAQINPAAALLFQIKTRTGSTLPIEVQYDDPYHPTVKQKVADAATERHIEGAPDPVIINDFVLMYAGRTIDDAYWAANSQEILRSSTMHFVLRPPAPGSTE